MFGPFTRRRFFANAIVALPLPRFLDVVTPKSIRDARLLASQQVRIKAATQQSTRPMAAMVSNGDETSLPARIGCYAKGFPQNQYGEVFPEAYDALLAAMKSGKYADFEALPRSGGRRQSNPQSGYAFHLEGGDPHTFNVPPAPSIASADCAFDVNEIYWQALCRDVHFSEYSSSPLIKRAATSLGTTPDRVFRGPTKGNETGPYVSQFLLKPIPFGSGFIEQRYNTPVAGSDYMTAFPEWAQIQAGFLPWRQLVYDETHRYIRNGRDLAEYVHYDFANQAYLSAALILINANAKSTLNCNQFKSNANPYRYSTVEEGFVTFGPAEAVDWIGRVSSAALKAAYCQKWMVHRRVRPEALGGLIHQTRATARKYPLHDSVLHADAVDAVHAKTATYLLPQAYPEACPMHPSYPSGHAAIAGACSVVLKACFDNQMLLPSCLEPSEDGLSVHPCANYSPLIGDEINKLTANIAFGRGWAGIHYRSDSEAGLQMGEEVGISILQDMALTYSENFPGFTFTRFDGTRINIASNGSITTVA